MIDHGVGVVAREYRVKRLDLDYFATEDEGVADGLVNQPFVPVPSNTHRIAVTADAELGRALERVRAAAGTREADARLVRAGRGGAEAELRAGRDRRAAAEALFAAMDGDAFDRDLAAIDRLNAV
jgi:hypothetical protein